MPVLRTDFGRHGGVRAFTFVAVCAMASAPALGVGESSFVVRTARPLGEAEREELAAEGVRFIAALGGSAHLVSAPDGGEALRAAGVFVEARELDADAKLHRLLAQGFVPPWTVVKEAEGAQGRLVALNVLFHPDVDLDGRAREVAAGAGARVISSIRSLNGLVLAAPEGAIRALASRPETIRIEPPLPRLGAMNAENRALTQAEEAQAAPYGLDGSGVSVLLYDVATADANHPDFGGRLTRRGSGATGQPQAHPTHVGGTIGGNGAASGGLHRGMAPGVTIESYGLGGWMLPDQPTLPDLLNLFFLDPGNLEATYFEAVADHDAAVANNSIGLNLTLFGGLPQACSYYGEYGVTSALVDSLTRGEVVAPIIINWAAGNPRYVKPDNCGLEYGTLSPPSSAKNPIVVGAVHADTDEITSFTAFGPTLDGRLKPDIAAPGCQEGGDGGVTSLAVGGGYLTACGTSMATPTVTGLVALMLEDHRARHRSVPDFLNSTAKAALAQTAADIDAPGPDFRTGYGSVRVVDAIEVMRRGDYGEVEIGHGGVVARTIVVGEGDGALKVTIAWDDAPGAPSMFPGEDASPKLVNDLDLHVYGPGGARHYPWTLDPADPAALATRDRVDRINNVEQVFVEHPEAGVWRVEVHGYDVPVAPQVFSYAATHALLADSCPADLSGDGAVGAADLAILLGAWGEVGGAADLNGDETVNAVDLGLLLGAWGACL